VIAQRYDAKILTALLAVGDCIYFDLGTPECAWQRPSRSELPPVHWVSPVASRIRTEALLASSLLTIPLAQQSTLTASRLLRWTRSEHPSLVEKRLWRAWSAAIAFPASASAPCSAGHPDQRATPSRSDLSPPHAWVNDWLDHTGPDPESRLRVSDLYCLPSCASARLFSTSASGCLAVERGRRARRASAP